MIEVSLVLVLVVAVSLALWQIFNKQKMDLVNLSKANITSSSTLSSSTTTRTLSFEDIRAQALALTRTIGVPVSDTYSMRNLLGGLDSLITSLESNPSTSASQLASYKAQYIEILNNLIALDTTNGGTAKTDIFNLASSLGISVGSNPNLGEVMETMHTKIYEQLFAAGSNQTLLRQANDNRSKLIDISNELAQFRSGSITTTVSVAAGPTDPHIEVSGGAALTDEELYNRRGPDTSGVSSEIGRPTPVIAPDSTGISSH